MRRIRKNLHTLHVLKNASPALIKGLICKADKDLVGAICECAHNILNGNIKLTKSQRRKLTKHKSGLRALVDKRVSHGRKRKVIQKGGFLGSLLSAALPVIAGLFGNLFGKR